MKIFEFNDYRGFLKSHIQSQPKRGWGYVKKIADHLRITPVQVSQVLSGSKEFTDEQALDLCALIGLSDHEKDYWLRLVDCERAGSASLKKYLKTQLEQIKAQAMTVRDQIPASVTLTDEQRAVFYSDWVYSGIRLFCSTQNGRTIEEVVSAFNIERNAAAEILRFLVSCGLCKFEKGVFTLGEQRTVIDKSSPFLKQHHVNWRLRSIDRARPLKDGELMFTSPVSLSEKDFVRVKSDLLALIKSFSGTVKESPAETVACLNIDWFRIQS